MFWKKWPYWLRKGIMGSGIFLIYEVLGTIILFLAFSFKWAVAYIFLFAFLPLMYGALLGNLVGKILGINNFFLTHSDHDLTLSSLSSFRDFVPSFLFGEVILLVLLFLIVSLGSWLYGKIKKKST